MPSVAFQGDYGAFSEMAARQHFGDCNVIPCRDFQSTTAMLLSGGADYAVLPVENSLAGFVEETQQLLDAARLDIQADFWVPITQSLMALPGITITALRSVLSHPVALAQCENFFRDHPHLEPQPWYDTAGAAKHIARIRHVSQGAIASRLAAERYGLAILKENIADSPDNRTRFVVVARP